MRRVAPRNRGTPDGVVPRTNGWPCASRTSCSATPTPRASCRSRFQPASTSCRHSTTSPSQVTYDYFHGYRYVDRNGSTPEFPFGFGLSYTTFTVDNLQRQPGKGQRRRCGPLQRRRHQYRLRRRSGGRSTLRDLPGLFSGCVQSGSSRALPRSLSERSETQTVEIAVPVNDLAYYDVSRIGVDARGAGARESMPAPLLATCRCRPPSPWLPSDPSRCTEAGFRATLLPVLHRRRGCTGGAGILATIGRLMLVGSAKRHFSWQMTDSRASTFRQPAGSKVERTSIQARNKLATLVLLFHQAGWSRGEYREIAP